MVRKYLWKVLCLEKGQLQQTAQCHVQLGLSSCKDGGSKTTLGKFFHQKNSHLTTITVGKKVPLMFQIALLYFLVSQHVTNSWRQPKSDHHCRGTDTTEGTAVLWGPKATFAAPYTQGQDRNGWEDDKNPCTHPGSSAGCITLRAEIGGAATDC